MEKIPCKYEKIKKNKRKKKDFIELWRIMIVVDKEFIIYILKSYRR